jgi:hypothetical protein
MFLWAIFFIWSIACLPLGTLFHRILGLGPERRDRTVGVEGEGMVGCVANGRVWGGQEENTREREHCTTVFLSQI